MQMLAAAVSRYILMCYRTRDASYTQNEWYKAAYYNPATGSYYQYPSSSNAVPTASVPTAMPNSANYNNAVGNLTDVGAYTGTTSPYGAFDMGGDVNQWNEDLNGPSPRGVRGGFVGDASFYMLSTFRSAASSTDENASIGFRVAMVPEPSSIVLAAFGFVGLLARG